MWLCGAVPRGGPSRPGTVKSALDSVSFLSDYLEAVTNSICH
jgi:hypothetical protein